MVNVRLAKDWTDGAGTAYSAGETVEVDAATLARLETAGIVVGPEDGGGETDWPGPTGTDPDWPGPTGTTPDWPGPTGTNPDWPGPTAS
jgi:hypothetical protein